MTNRNAGARKPLTPDDSRHGTVNAYVNFGCRCIPCRDANTEYHYSSRGQQRYRERLRATQGDPGFPHGTLKGYQHGGCRCEACSAASNEVYRRRKARSR